MNLELKKVKIHPDMSDETNCFSATICVDGKKIGSVSNDGGGGCHRYWWATTASSEDVKRLKAWADAQPLEFDFDKLDQIINAELEKNEYRSWLKRHTKKKTLFRVVGDKKGSWREIGVPFDAKVQASLRNKNPDLECIANEDLEAALPFCKSY